MRQSDWTSWWVAVYVFKLFSNGFLQFSIWTLIGICIYFGPFLRQIKWKNHHKPIMFSFAKVGHGSGCNIDSQSKLKRYIRNVCKSLFLSYLAPLRFVTDLTVQSWNFEISTFENSIFEMSIFEISIFDISIFEISIFEISLFELKLSFNYSKSGRKHYADFFVNVSNHYIKIYLHLEYFSSRAGGAKSSLMQKR